MQRYIINIKLQNLNLFLKLISIKKPIVIRFKINIFALSDTTMEDYGKSYLLLWFALKLVSLHYQTQLNNICVVSSISCDLL